MKVKIGNAIAALKSRRTWLEMLRKKPTDRHFEQAEDIVCACLDILDLSPTSDVRGWLKRRPERKVLNNPQKAAKSTAGRSAMFELIDFTLSELEASAAFLKDVWIGNLPARASKSLSVEHIEAMQRGAKKKRQEEAAELIQSARRKFSGFSHELAVAIGVTED